MALVASFGRDRGRPNEGMVILGSERGRPLLLQILGFLTLRQNCQNKQTVNHRLVAESATELAEPVLPILVPANPASGIFLAVSPTFPYGDSHEWLKIALATCYF